MSYVSHIFKVHTSQSVITKTRGHFDAKNTIQMVNDTIKQISLTPQKWFNCITRKMFLMEQDVGKTNLYQDLNLRRKPTPFALGGSSILICWETQVTCGLWHLKNWNERSFQSWTWTSSYLGNYDR